MSGVSPSRRLQLKTSDLTEFFRGSSSNTVNSDSISPTVLLEEQQAQGVSPSKRRSTRIPFIGRSRKKSTHSEVVPFPTSVAEAQEGRPSAATSRSRSLLDEQREVVSPQPPQPRASTSQPSLEASQPSTQPTFGSKIAAHFTPSKLRLPSRKSIRRPAANRPSGDILDYASDTLAPPRLLPRSPSIDSASSRGSRRDDHNRSTTPKPDHPQFSQVEPQLSQPTITISHPPVDPYNLDEFEDLFTKPRHKQKPLPIAIISEGCLPISYPGSDSLDRGRENNRLSPSSPNAPSLPASVNDSTTGDATPGASGSGDSTPTPRAGLPGAMELRNPVAVVYDSDCVSVMSEDSLPSRKQSVFAAKQQYHRDTHIASEVDLESAEESEAVSMKSSRSMPSSSRANANTRMTLVEKRRTLAAMPYGYKPAEMSRKLLSLQGPSSKPPSIPLPSPPSPSSPLKSPKIPTDVHAGGPRPRAHTISPNHSLPLSGSPLVSSSLSTPAAESQASKRSSDSSSSSSTLTLTQLFSKIEPTMIDVDTASPDQLREALRQRNKQYDDLAEYLSKALEAHVAEKTALENKITHLERESMRKDKEIKGLTWMVMNNRSPGGGSLRVGAVPQTGSKVTNMMGKKESDDSSAHSLVTPPPSVRLPLYSRLRAKDSGAESYPTSTTEWGSGTSGAEESMGESDLQASRTRRAMKKLKLVESANRASPITRSIPVRQPGSQTSSGEMYASIPRLSKRSSTSSAISSSGTIVSSSSSTSSPSQSPTSMTFPTSSTLSAIPESRPTSALSTSTTERAVSPSSSTGKEDRARERRQSKISIHRSPSLSASPPVESSSSPVKASSRLTPSEAYVRNLKKGRPSSIAQVLDRNTDSAIEKSYGGGSRALLAGLSVPSK